MRTDLFQRWLQRWRHWLYCKRHHRQLCCRILGLDCQRCHWHGVCS